eukprot:scaffold35117_cov129-Isochrysis_galbana.AAC.1
MKSDRVPQERRWRNPGEGSRSIPALPWGAHFAPSLAHAHCHGCGIFPCWRTISRPTGCSPLRFRRPGCAPLLCVLSTSTMAVRTQAVAAPAGGSR